MYTLTVAQQQLVRLGKAQSHYSYCYVLSITNLNFLFNYHSLQRIYYISIIALLLSFTLQP